MDIPEDFIKKLNKSSTTMASKLGDTFSNLTNNLITCSVTGIGTGEDELDGLIEFDLATGIENGLNTGNAYIFYSKNIAILLTGLMMMIPVAILKADVAKNKQTDEVIDGFKEIANQTMGTINDVLERTVEDSHLFLTDTLNDSVMPDLPEKLICISFDVKIGEIGTGQINFLFPVKLCEKITKIIITEDEVTTVVNQPAIVEEITEVNVTPKLLVSDIIDYFELTFDENTRIIDCIKKILKSEDTVFGISKDKKVYNVITYNDARQAMGPFWNTAGVIGDKEKKFLSFPVKVLTTGNSSRVCNYDDNSIDLKDRITEGRKDFLMVKNPDGTVVGYITTKSLLKLLGYVAPTHKDEHNLVF